MPIIQIFLPKTRIGKGSKTGLSQEKMRKKQIIMWALVAEKHVKKRGNPRKKRRKNREKTDQKTAIMQ